MAEITVDKFKSVIALELDSRKASNALKGLKKFEEMFKHAFRSAEVFNKALKKLEKNLDRVVHSLKGATKQQGKFVDATTRAANASGRRLKTPRVPGMGTPGGSSGRSRGGRRAHPDGGGVKGGIAGTVAMGAAGMAIGGAVMVGKGLVSATESAIDFETKMADVRKVVDGLDDPKQFDAMGKSIRDLSNRLPIASDGIADIVAAAGQAGIAKEDLIGFAESAAKVGVAFDITAEQAGDALAKVQTSMGLSLDDTKMLMGTVNQLSNSMASSAPEILKVVQGVGALGQTAGLAGEKTAALGSAMVAAGANASNATTATKNLFLALGQGANAPKKTQEAFKALGLSSKKVAEDMQKDAEATIRDVFNRINQLKPDEQTPVITQIFGKLSAGAIGPLISNLDLLDKAFTVANDKVGAASSIQKEFESRANTTANTIQLLKNRWENFKIEVGNKVLPLLKKLFQAFDNPAVQKFIDEAMSGVMKAVEFLIENFPSVDGMFENLIGVAKQLWSTFESLWKIAKPLFEVLFETSVAVGKEVIGIFKELGGAIDELSSIFSMFFSNGEGEANSFGRTIIDVFKFGIVGAFRVVKDAVVGVKEQFRLFREMLQSFSEGNILDGLKNIGEMLLNAVLAPLRLLVRELTRITDAIPGMEGFMPKSIREFAFGKGAPETKTYGEVAKDAVAAAKGEQTGGWGSRFNETVGGAVQKGLQEAGYLVESSAFVGPEDPTITMVGPGLYAPKDKGKGKKPPGGLGKGEGETPKEDKDAFQQLIDSKIEERVKAAELRAGAAGLDVKTASIAARKEAEKLARERRFAALGIDPLSLLGPSAGMGVGAADKPPISITVIYVQAGAITGGINFHDASFTGGPEANGRAMYNMIIDQLSQVAQLRATPQVT